MTIRSQSGPALKTRFHNRTASSRRDCRAWLPLGTLVLVAGFLTTQGCGEPAANSPATGTETAATAAAPGATAQTAAPSEAAPAPAPAQPAAAPVKPETAKPPVAPPPVEQTVDADQVNTVRKLLDDSMSSDSKVAQSALDRLKEMGSLAALALAEIVEKDTDVPKRRVAALDQLESMKFLTNPRAAKVVVAALEDGDITLKQHAIGACGRHKLKDGIPALKKIMNDPEQKALQMYAAQALVELGDADALALAKTLLGSEDPIIRAKAVYIIRKQGDHANLNLLKPLTTDKDDDVRLELVEACGDLGDIEAVEILGAMLDDKRHDVVRDACKHLKRITGVNLGREPEKWKEWYLKEFVPKGRAAFGKTAEARPAPAQTLQSKIRPKGQPGPGGPNMPPPPPKDGNEGNQTEEGDHDY